ncbi:histidine--tRNA ligase [Thiobacter aerophilum]|uniref:Histidine--tRNA ligase n=1 Tax=Thiobacter aerophilum TaxID=3121275 RepID=A0ABV0EJF2_9BURK
MAVSLQAVRGMNDILPQQIHAWEWFEDTVRDWLASYGYRGIRTPIVEHTALFKRAIGEVTDIVEKEMYTFEDALNGESLTLRPEGTAACVRAALQHGLLAQGLQRLWYMGPMFRHERPQRGRYRQFHQVGVEALGWPGPDMDVEHIVMIARLWKRLGITDVALEINTLGTAEDRARHRARLIHYLERHQDLLDEDARRRLYTNPLRILDSKNPALQELVAEAPKLLDDLDEVSLVHFEGVQARLRQAGVSFVINPRLVRGLDYYNFTVFEWVTHKLGAQGTLCAGGRYDGLVEQLGGRPTPACGFALGIERVLALREEQGQRVAPSGPDVYVVHAGSGVESHALSIAEGLRDAGFKVVLHCGGGSFKSQMKKADASGARFALIIGEDEMARGVVGVKALREAAEQVQATREELPDLLRRP